MPTDVSQNLSAGRKEDWLIVISNVASAFASKDSATVREILELVEGLSKILAVPSFHDSSAKPSDFALTANSFAPEPTANETAVPAVPIETAVNADKVICLCCGQAFKMLKRHLKAEHGLSEAEYREKFSLPEDMPLVAPSYSAKKAEHARAAGFGRHSRDA